MKQNEVFIFSGGQGTGQEQMLQKAVSVLYGHTAPEDDWGIALEQRGKPYFRNHPELAFSPSDSGEETVIAFDDRRIGMDFQRMRLHGRKQDPASQEKRRRRLAAHAYHPDEAEFLKAGDEALRFFMIWSAKEAYVKYTGDGIDDYFSSFSILPEDPGALHPERDGRRGLSWSALHLFFYARVLGGGRMLCICREAEKPVCLRDENGKRIDG